MYDGHLIHGGSESGDPIHRIHIARCGGDTPQTPVSYRLGCAAGAIRRRVLADQAGMEESRSRRDEASDETLQGAASGAIPVAISCGALYNREASE